jgi:ABC-type nitrate/sulfonate/bicarbonate transport system permease component
VITVHKLANALWGAVGILSFLAIWEAASRSGLINQAALPAPSTAIAVTLRTVAPVDLLDDALISLQRIVLGFAIGATLGVAVGIASSWVRWFGVVVSPFVELLRPIPPLAWIPMAIIWFGLGEPPKVFVIILGAFFPVVTNSYQGMMAIDPMLFRAAQTMGVRGIRLLLQVALPAAMPDIATGLRIGWGLSFGTLVAAELIAADSGLGYLIMHARELGEVSVLVCGILIIGLANLATDWCIGRLIRSTLGRWHAV